MTRSRLAVDIAFNAGYSTAAASRTWTDVSAYVLLVNGTDIAHGRQDESAQADANTCTLTLNNADGRFTPDLASSPYYPNVKIGRPLRVCINLCTHGDDGTFEADATSWTGINATAARTTAQAHSGTASLAVTATSAASISGNTPSGTSGIPVVASTEYRASAWVRTAVTSRTTDMRLDWYDAAGALISTSNGTDVADSTTWQQVTLTATSPATAAFARIRPLWVGAAIGEVHYLDDVRLDVDRFVGYIDEWPLEWPAVVDTFATSTITASSKIARLGLSDPMRSLVEEEILLDGPIAYYVMGEPEGSTRANDSSGTNAPTLVAARYAGTLTDPDHQSTIDPVFGSATGPGTDGHTAVQFPSTATAATKVLRATGDSFTLRGVGFFFSQSETALSITSPLFTVGAAESPSIQIELRSNTEIRVNDSGGSAIVSASWTADSATRHAFVRQNGADVELYIDGALVDTNAGSLGTCSSYFVGPTDFSDSVTLAHLALYDTAPTAARIAAHADAGLDGFEDETPASRLAHYAELAGIPAAEYSFSSLAVTPMAHIDTTDQTPIELMQKVAETDGGVLYDARDGTLTYQARSARYNSTATLALDASASEVAATYSPKYDRSALINKLTATLADGTYSVTAVDTASKDEYGTHNPGDIELATTDADEAHGAAWWRVNTYCEPTARAPQLGVELSKMSAARQAAVLAVKVGDKITVSNLPSQSDSSSKSFFVEGWTETITDSSHRIEFNVSNAAGYEVWEIEHATYGQFDAYPISY